MLNPERLSEASCLEVITTISWRPLVFLLLLSASTSGLAQSDNVENETSSSDALLDALELSAETAATLSRHEQLLEQIRSESGPFDMRLQEPLSDLTNLLIEQGDRPAAIRMLNQQLQVIRVNLGLYSREQIGLIETQLRLYFGERDWESVNRSLDHLSWLFTRDPQTPVPDKLAGLYRLRDWHLLVLNHDLQQREPDHLLRIRELSQRALELAEAHYGEDSPELIKYIHGAAQADLYIALAIMLTPDTSSSLITMTEGIRASPLNVNQIRSERDLELVYGPKTTTVINRSFRNNMNSHFRHITRIRDFYAGTGDKEAEAMAVLLQGDSILMEDQYEHRPLRFAGETRGMGNIGFASKYYKEASELLLLSGFSREQIDAYFACPMILPVNEFSPDFEPDQDRCMKLPDEGYDLGQIHLLVDSVPDRAVSDHMEVNVDETENSATSSVRFTVLPNGQPGRVEVLDSNPDTVRNRSRAKSTVDHLQFRPAIENGRAVRRENIHMVLVLPE